MAITRTQFPGNWNFAYGNNIVTLSGITGASQKYVLQVRAEDGTTVLATLRQSPNANNVAQFDIQNILQSYVGVPKTTIDNLGIGTQIIETADTEVFEYKLKIGSESNGVITFENSITGPLQVIAGKKEYYQTDIRDSILLNPAYRLESTIEPEGGTPYCYTVSDAGNPMSGVRRSYDIQDNPYAWPSTYNSWDTVEKVWVEECRPGDRLTKSFWNWVGPYAEMEEVMSIGAFQILVYNGNSIEQEDIIPNTVGNGGGPKLGISDPNKEPTGADLVVTMGVGPANLNNFYYFNEENTATQFELPEEWTHYYIAPVGAQQAFCSSGVAWGQWGEPIINPILIIRKEDNCSDFDPMRLSWVNQYGFMDYYSFDKKNVKTIKTKRNTYLKEANDYNATSFSIDKGSRGTTTYSQTSEVTFEANTGYMTDEEANSLQYLWTSADVRVQSNRFGTEEYLPVVVTDSKWSEKTNRVDRLFQYTINFKLAHNTKTQRGN
tara:strand:- start:2147 stop:3622 length:1476 start_codon:yes stop_codon:yes gene_type:complete